MVRYILPSVGSGLKPDRRCPRCKCPNGRIHSAARLWRIGLTFKIRSKTVRGFKSRRKVLAHPYLASFLRGQAGICDLRKVI